MRWRQLATALLRPGTHAAPGYVEVHGHRVALPSPFEQAFTRSVDEADWTNGREHDGGCHGPDCDGRCAEVTYARWSPLFDLAGKG